MALDSSARGWRRFVSLRRKARGGRGQAEEEGKQKDYRKSTEVRGELRASHVAGLRGAGGAGA